MSAKLYQSMILQLHDDIAQDISVLDDSGVVLASTNPAKIGFLDSNAATFLQTHTDELFEDTYKKVFDSGRRVCNVICVSGSEPKSKEFASILAVSIARIKNLYDNKHDKSTFIKNILLDNILPGDIYVKSSELQIDEKSHKSVLLIRKDNLLDTNLLDVITKYVESFGHMVIYINERDLAVVYSSTEATNSDDLNDFASEILKLTADNGVTNISVGYGSTNTSLEHISRSYKEAQIALEVSEVFDNNKSIIGYQNLGIGRLIYQLPTTLCRMFLSEVFNQGSIDSLDEETLFTIKAFFENNLNVSETSRKLFVHRNTLVYRLEKIKKLTGLDLREFDHAIVFKVALMVRKYLDARDLEKILF